MSGNNSIINKFVNNLPFELHLADPKVGRYSACGPGTKHKKRVQDYIETGDTNHIFKNELDKACFYHDSGYSKFKDVANRQVADKVLMKHAINIANDESIDGYQRSLAAMVYAFFKKKIQMGQGTSQSQSQSLSQLADELHKPVRRTFQRRRVIVYTIDDVWGADLVDMTEWYKDNKGFKFLLTVIDVLSKHAWGVQLKDKRGDTVTTALKGIIESSNRKPNFLWVDEGGEFYNKTMKAYLDKNDIQMYSTYSENKSAVVERFNRTLKTNMWKRFTAENTRNWIDMLPKLFTDYNKRKHSSIKMSPIDASKKENEQRALNALYGNDRSKDHTKTIKSPKLKVGDTVRISRVKGLFEKGYLPNWSEEIYNVVKVQMTMPVTYIIKDLKDEVIKGSFYEQELQKTEQEIFRIEKILQKKKIKGRQHGLVKWIGYNNDFNEWLPMSEIKNLS
jgi:transposase InsO family protein